MFEEIRNEVKEVIKNSNNNEIDNNSNNKNIGIYMIYIDNFNDDKIIPIYIGQTGYGKNRNFQNRYKEHLQEVMALNRLRYDYYKYVLLSNFYDGHYKACKIFQYMVDHDCTLKDFHMIVLEELDINNNNIQELLDKKEQEYFSKYLPAFFGFNQTNAVTEGAKEAFSSIKEDGKYVKSDKLLKYELEDCENFLKYFGYGYTKFNYYHCFPKTHIIEENDKKISYELKEKKDLLKSKYYDENKFKIYNDKLLKLEEKRKKLVKKIEDYKKQFEDVYAPRIKEYCKENKIGLAQKYKEIINMLIYQNKNSISDFEKYLKRKKINVNILNILNKDTKFTNWRKQYIEYTENNNELKCEINECRYIRRTDDLMRILPKKEYDEFPLKDKYQEIEFNDLEDNELVINFEFSNHGINWDDDFSLIKMDYKLYINNKNVEKKNIFIKSYKENEENEDYYIEKDFGAEFKFRKTPFRVTNFPNYISTAMEIQNGINDFTLKDKPKIDVEEILDELNGLINEKTKVKIEVRNKMKTKCKEFIDCRYRKDNLLKKKILNYLSKRR